MTTPAKQELRDLIRSKLTDHMMTIEQATDAVMSLFWDAADDWQNIDITRFGDQGTRVMEQRWPVARIPRESKQRLTVPERSASLACTCPDIDVSRYPGDVSFVKGLDPNCGLHGRTVTRDHTSQSGPACRRLDRAQGSGRSRMDHPHQQRVVDGQRPGCHDAG